MRSLCVGGITIGYDPIRLAIPLGMRVGLAIYFCCCHYYYLQCTFRKTRLLTAGGTSLEAMHKYAPIWRRTTWLKFK